MKKFVVVGAAGYIAGRHFDAIAATGNRIVGIVDPNDSGAIGKVDQYSLEADYFPRFEELVAEIMAKRLSVDYITVCSPNDQHFLHCQGALCAGAQVICEKPLVIDPQHLNALKLVEAETRKRIRVILQYRHHPKLVSLRETLLTSYPSTYRHDVNVTFILPRGKWFQHSWKGKPEQSGGIAMHLGIHIFDLLLWMFGGVHSSEIHVRQESRMAGVLELERARVKWFLSSDPADLPEAAVGTQGHRSFTIGESQIEFSDGRLGLHTIAYEEILAGRGFGIEDARPAIELVYHMNRSPVVDYLPLFQQENLCTPQGSLLCSREEFS